MKVQIIRTDGRDELLELPKLRVFAQLEKLLDAASLDGVNLRDGRVMFVDDNGYECETIEHPATETCPFTLEVRPIRARKPLNEKATALYHSVCVPGTTHRIVGDVAIVRDEDFA